MNVKEVLPMPACPNCHIFKGLWSPLAKTNDNVFVCKMNGAHKYTRDAEGNFHSVR